MLSTDSRGVEEPVIINLVRYGATHTLTGFIRRLQEDPGVAFQVRNKRSYRSTDGVTSGGLMPLPAGYTDSADPVLAHNGTTGGVAPERTYMTGLTLNRGGRPNFPGANPTSIRVWISVNGGSSWTSSGSEVDVIASSTTSTLDKPWIAGRSDDPARRRAVAEIVHPGEIMLRPRLLTLVLLIANAGAVFAADAWVLRGFAGPCLGLQWEADTLLLNTLPAPAVVRLVSISDGPDPFAEPDRELVLPPGQTLSLNRNTDWHSGTDVLLFVLRLDIPEGVLIEGVLNLGTGSGEGCPLPPAPDGSAAYGVIHLPHFRALVSANEEQIHLSTTLGGNRARNNVGIYNAAAMPATARVSLHRACDNRLVDETTIQLAANSTTQVRLENKSPDTCTGEVPTWVDYVTVTVDQPSVTWVSTTLANGVPPRVLISIR